MSSWTSRDNCREKGEMIQKQTEGIDREREWKRKECMRGSSVPVWLELQAEPNFIRPSIPTVWLPHLPAVPRGDATHTHAHKVLCIACTHMLLQASELAHTHTHGLKLLRRNKSWRAGWSPFCFLSKSCIFAPQQRRRHHNLPSTYRVSFPAAKRKKKMLRVFVCCVYLSRPLRGQTVWVSCGRSESVVKSERLFKTEWMWL